MMYRRPVVVVFHLVLVALSNLAAFWLRFDGDIPERELTLLFQMLPWLILIRGLTFMPFRLFEGLWRYTSVWDLRNIVAGIATSSAVFYLLVHRCLGLQTYPRSVFIIDSLLLISLLSTSRLSRRIYREFRRLDRDKRVLIYGAGDAGEMVARDMRHNAFYEYEPGGFVDDDPSKVGRRIHGVKVLGTREDLARIMADLRPDAVVVAMPRAAPAVIRSVVRSLESFKVPIHTLPNLRDLMDGKVTVSQIRPLSVDDLLERAPVGLDTAPLRQFIRRKRVLVTGGGGSIGSELARQIATLEPAALVLVDRYENGLYAVSSDLGSRSFPVEVVIGDVTDADRVKAVLAAHHPEIVFHAAAHKHVPLMEINPCEAVKNNVRGTRIVAETAQDFEVERFVLVSTDKAVNPTSVMGATKRVAELLVQSLNGRGAGVFTSVRFGNVLASNGSVVPRFMAQIKAGGPVTVTHPDMRRYFMLIPEAVHLVLHAASLARGGDTFVLEMGEQVRVLDLARNLIRLSGFVPDEEIPITFVGIRPGEKLFEELVASDETAQPSASDRILHLEPKSVPDARLLAHRVAEIEMLADFGKTDEVIVRLCALVPTYEPNGQTLVSTDRRDPVPEAAIR